MLRRFLAAFAVAALTFAAPALATVRKDVVKFRVPRSNTAPMVAGQPWQGDIDVFTRPGTDIADFEFVGDGWQVEPLRTGASRDSLSANGRARLPLRVTRANPLTPLSVRFTANGVVQEQELSLHNLAGERPKVGHLRAATPAEIASAPVFTNAETYAKPEPAFDRSSVDSEGQPRGIVGTTRITDAPEGGTRAAGPNGAQSANAKNIRVHGRLAGNGPVSTFGADGVYFAVYDEDSGIDELLAEGTTDVNGNYDVTFTWDPCTFCDDNPDIYVYFETETSHVICQSPSLEWEYSWETGVTADFKGTDLDKGTFMPGDTESDGVLYAQTALTRIWRWFNSQGWNVPVVEVQCWDSDASTVSYYVGFFEEIHLAPGRMFNTTSMAHEYGHHWMENFSNNPDPSYCNGNCDSPSCGHCFWCQELGQVVWSEGVPDFQDRFMTDMFNTTYPGFTNDIRDVEAVQQCGTLSRVDDGFKTEGLFAGALYDIVDSANEKDPAIPGLASDQLSQGAKLIYTIFDTDEPQTVNAFFAALDQRLPGQRVAIWSTAMNAGVNIDGSAPGVVTGLASSDHTVNVLSHDVTIQMSWGAAPDDWSGAWAYSVSFVNSPSIPDTVAELVGGGLSAKSGYLAPGTWYACVRARDRFGRWSGSYAQAGPYILGTPDPADLTVQSSAGWYRPVVPRATADATTGNVTKPATLTGSNIYYWNATGLNSGQAQVNSGFVRPLLDGVDGNSSAIGTVNPDAPWFQINQSYVFVRSGRHTIGAFVDASEIVAETNETNNTWARQWAFSPSFVPLGNAQNRPAPPWRIAGHDDIGAGESSYYNSDGMAFTSSGWWNAVWVYATELDKDDDVKLHYPSTSVDTAFASTIASSARGAGYLDAVIVNRNTLGQLNWHAGVVNYDDNTSNYRIKQVVSSSFSFGDSLDVNFPADEFITLHDLYVSSLNLGDVMVTLRTAAGGQPVQLQWRDRTFGYGGLSSYTKSAVTDSNGMARFIVNAASSGYYGVACFRDPKDGGGALPFTLQVERAPADLATITPSGWYSPVVPRPATDGTFASVPMPDTLNSTPSPTYFNIAAKNVGTLSAPATTSWMMVDGALAATYGYPTWNAGAQMLVNSTYAVYIRGGRHTLSHVLDGPDLVEEVVAANNQYGEQYVWAPLSLAVDSPVTRTAPPDRMAGWTEVSENTTKYFNVDGLRTASAPPAGGNNQWSAIAVMPAATSDVDLRLHETSPGTKNGFRNPIASSIWGAGLSDFVLVNFNSTTYRRFDVGAMRYDGTDNYTAQATTSMRRVIQGGVVGTFTQGPNDLLDLHEVWLTPGTWGITLETTAGNANLGLSVHGSAAYQGKSNALGTAWLQPAGASENVTLNIANAGWYCLAVWKTGSEDLAQTATYKLIATSGTLDAGDEMPHAVAFGSPWPNPSAGATSVWFALPMAGHVEVDVYDVSGARVRTLVRGEEAAGRHTVAWDGRTDAGQRAPAGLYYLRFQGGGVTESRKVVRIE